MKLFCRWPSYAGAAVMLICSGCHSYRYTGRLVGKTDCTSNPSTVVEERYHIGAIDVHSDSSKFLKCLGMIDSDSVVSSLARKNQNLSGASGSAESVLLEVHRIADREEGAFGSFLNHVTLGLLPFSKERTSEFYVAIYPFEKKGMKPVWFKAEMTQEERFTPLFFWPFFWRGEGDVSHRYAGFDEKHERVIRDSFVDLIDAGMQTAIPRYDAVRIERGQSRAAATQKRNVSAQTQKAVSRAADKATAGHKKMPTSVLPKENTLSPSNDNEKVSLETMLKDGLITREEYERMKK